MHPPEGLSSALQQSSGLPPAHCSDTACPAAQPSLTALLHGIAYQPAPSHDQVALSILITTHGQGPNSYQSSSQLQIQTAVSHGMQIAA